MQINPAQHFTSLTQQTHGTNSQRQNQNKVLPGKQFTQITKIAFRM